MTSFRDLAAYSPASTTRCGHDAPRGALAHDPGHAAGLVAWRGDPLFEKTARRRPKIARPHIGPGAAAVLLLAGGFAGRALRIRIDVDIAVVAAGAVDRELDRAGPFLRHTCALHAGDAAGVFMARRDLALEPAGGARRGRARIGEAPGRAAPVALASRRANRRIPRA